MTFSNINIAIYMATFSLPEFRNDDSFNRLQIFHRVRAKTRPSVCLAPSHPRRPVRRSTQATSRSRPACKTCCSGPARSAAAGRGSPTPPAGLPLKVNAKLDALLHIIPTHAAGEKLKAAIEACRHSLFVFLANRAVPPTSNALRAGAAALRRVPKSSPTASGPNGPRILRRQHPIRLSKPRAAAPSASSTLFAQPERIAA